MSPTAHPRSHAALLACLCVLAAPGCGRPGADSEDAGVEASGGARRRELPRVRVTEVEQREMVYVLETTSTLESENEIEVLPRIPGVVTEILAEEGDRVQAGDVLARLDDRDQVLEVRNAEVAYAEAQNAVAQAALAIDDAEANVRSSILSADQAARDHERNQQLFEGETVSALSRKALEDSLLARDAALAAKEMAEISLRRRQLDHKAAETSLARSEVALERARLTLSYTSITAPFVGIVAERNVRVGDAVNTGGMAFVLTDTDHLRMVFLRPQEELGLFTRSASGAESITLSATAEAHPGRVFHGHIERISPTIQASSGQFRVTARIVSPPESESAPLLPGMLMRMQIVTDRHPDALVVPKRALRREGDTRFVLVVEGTGETVTVRKEVVVEGFSDEDDVEVLPARPDAIDPGDLIVEIGSRDLENGDAVHIEDAAGAPLERVESEALADVGEPGEAVEAATE